MAQRSAGFHRSPLHHLSYLSSIISLFYLLPSCLLSLLLSLINRHRLDVWQSSSANQQATQHTTKRYKPQNTKNRKIHSLINRQLAAWPRHPSSSNFKVSQTKISTSAKHICTTMKLRWTLYTDLICAGTSPYTIDKLRNKTAWRIASLQSILKRTIHEIVRSSIMLASNAK